MPSDTATATTKAASPHLSDPEYTAAFSAILPYNTRVNGATTASGGAPTSPARPLRRPSAGWSLLHGISKGIKGWHDGGTGRHAWTGACGGELDVYVCCGSPMMADAPLTKRDQACATDPDRGELYLRKADEWQCWELPSGRCKVARNIPTSNSQDAAHEMSELKSRVRP
jgi:hypothetical protein